MGSKIEPSCRNNWSKKGVVMIIIITVKNGNRKNHTMIHKITMLYDIYIVLLSFKYYILILEKKIIQE